jgi:hypothetical protein
MGDNKDSLAFLQNFISGQQKYSQEGTGIPSFSIGRDYEGGYGTDFDPYYQENISASPGRLADKTIAQGIPVGDDPIFPMDQEQFSDYIRYRLDKKSGVQPLPISPERRNKINAARIKLGFV